MIAFACTCGGNLQFADDFAGKKVTCPTCGRQATVPARGTVNQETTLLRSADTSVVADRAALVTASSQEALAPPRADGAAKCRWLGGYRILRQLGQGGMGAVFEAEDDKLKRRVALKVMKPELASNPEYRERFLREARTAASVESDFICPIYQVGEENGVPFIAMPFLKGEPLDASFKQSQPLAIDAIVRIGKEVAEGLSVAHEAGLIHRDIKPANIWLETQRKGPPRARILDFGLARNQSDDVHITHSGAIVGTPAFMSPEQGRGEKSVDARTDLFSLGSVLYTLCTGQLPFMSESTMGILTALATKDPVPPHTISAATPRPLSKLIMRLLAKNPDHRPQTARDVIQEFGAIERSLANPASPPRKRSRARLALIAAGLLGCAIALAVGIHQLVNNRETTTADNGPAAKTDAETDKSKGEPKDPPPPEKQPGPGGMTFVKVPAGTFWMSHDRKNAQRQETIKDDFYLAQHTVTQGQWLSMMGNNPSSYSREGLSQVVVKTITDEELEQFPVENVSWNEAQEFLKRLNEKEKGRGWLYRLPTEAEWEYACRGAVTSKEDCSFDFYFDRPTNDLDATQANIRGDSPAGKGTMEPGLYRPCKVGSFQPNRLGLYDMHGNVWQWCDDLFDAKAAGAQIGQAERVFRGGGWRNPASECRAGYRRGGEPSGGSAYVGFRVARVPE